LAEDRFATLLIRISNHDLSRETRVRDARAGSAISTQGRYFNAKDAKNNAKDAKRAPIEERRSPTTQERPVKQFAYPAVSALIRVIRLSQRVEGDRSRSRPQRSDPRSRIPVPDSRSLDVTSQTKKTHTETANPNHLKMIQAENR
jgi:hypothetical protein